MSEGELYTKVREATLLGLRYGMVDGAHHKMWVIDQMLRILLGDRYDEFVAVIDNMEYHEWDTGIAP